MAGERRVTSVDVAREAGLSRATVSYVLNDTPNQRIPEATRQRVLEAAARLGYAPSAAARVLRSGRSDVVLTLLPDWPIGPAIGSLLEVLSTALAEQGLTFVVHPRGHAPRPVSEVLKAIAPAAVLSWTDIAPDDAAVLRASGVEVALSLAGTDGVGDGLTADAQQHVGSLQAAHLAERGHHRLGYALADDARLAFFSAARLAGVRRACAALGLAEPDVRTVPLNPEGARDAVRAWREPGSDVTAVCAYNDDVALALLGALRREGLRAPDDLAVIGVDDLPAARSSDPGLTTLHHHVDATARHLAATIVARLEGRTAPGPVTTKPYTVVVRGST